MRLKVQGDHRTCRATMVVACLGVVLLSGCATSGLDAENKFACKAPDGVTCMSVSGIYANAKENNLPGLRKREDDAQSVSAIASMPDRVVAYNYDSPMDPLSGLADKTSPKSMNAPHSGAPLRTPERILRVWLAPFEDQEGDLHDQKYFYVTVNTGSWTIQANKAQIRSKFQSVHSLSKNNPANKGSDAPASQQTPQQAAASTLPVSPVPMPMMSSND